MTIVRKLKKQSRLKRPLMIGTASLMVLGSVMAFFSFLPSSPVKAQDDYTFGTELVNKGSSADPTEKNTENAAYNSLYEADQYPDTNFSGSSENVVTGTTGGGTFPSALDTDDSTRRNYIEASSGDSPYTVFINPTSDVQNQWDTPASPTTHWDLLDDAGTADLGDSGTTKVATATATDVDIYGMADISDPGTGYTITVTLYCVNSKSASQACNIQAGIRIGSTNYQGITRAPTTSYVNTSSSAWTVNPATTNAWTYTEVNALNTYLATSDASPQPYCTKLVLKISVTYATLYTLDAQITYSSVTATSQTTGFQVLCQGYRTGDTENIDVQAWNHTSSAWVTKTTISAGSDTDYSFNLLGWDANCERSSGDVVLLRLVDAGGDATQTTVLLDVLKVQRIEQGYWLNVELTSTTVAQYGNITLRIKGYTSAESFHVDVWNYTSGAYDTNKLTISSLSNTWQTTLDLVDASHRSTQTVKIRLMDDTNYTTDTTADTLYLDVAWVSRYHTDPTITLYGAQPQTVGSGQAVSFFANYSDYDNDAPSFMYVSIDTSDFSLTKNDSGDVSYYNGVNYSLSKSDLSLGEHTCYFRAQDASSGVVTTATAKVYINATPALSSDTVFPATGNVGESFNFSVAFNDTDGEVLLL